MCEGHAHPSAPGFRVQICFSWKEVGGQQGEVQCQSGPSDARMGLRHSNLAFRMRPLPRPTSPWPHRGFHSAPLFCFCIWFCDSFKDTNMPQNSDCSQPGLSCCPHRHRQPMFNPLFSRFCKHAVFIQISNQHDPSPLLSNPAFQPHAWSDFGFTHTHTHTHVCAPT